MRDPKIRHRLLSPLLAALALLGALGAAPPGSTPARLRTFDIPHRPVKIHDKSEGWAEYPEIAANEDHIALTFSVDEDGRSRVYYHIIPRDFGGTTGAQPLTGLDEDGFRPCVDVVGDTAFIAWTSYGRSGWKIRACVDTWIGASKPRRLKVYDGDGFNSQVRVTCGESSAWFVWTRWHDGEYSVLARRCAGRDFEMGDVMTVHQGPNPVGRADLKALYDDHIVVAWDEYVEGRFVIRAREIRGGDAGPVENLSGPEYAYEWGPRLAGSAGNILVAWQGVPGGERHSLPRARELGGGTLHCGLGRRDDDETWRVRCLEEPGGRNVVAWATRRGYRRTYLYMRAVADEGYSRTVQVIFPMRRTFINWFDCELDGRLVLTYEYSGSVYLYDVKAPGFSGPVAQPREGTEGRERTGADGGTGDRPAGTPPELRVGPGYSTEYGGKTLNLYFGDYHNHTSFSDGRAYPDISYITARDYRRFDFMGVSDHDDTNTPGEFAWSCAVCDELTEDGEYVCLYGYEQSKGWAQNGFGHWNALLWEKGDIFHFEEGMTPEDLYRHAKWNDMIFIPHHIGVSWAPHNWDCFDADAEPVVEILSIHGIYENDETCSDPHECVDGSMISDGLERGYRFGIVGGSDYHNCFAAVMDERSITAVYAEELTRGHILDAIRRRRTYATTGDKIVVDFRCNGKFMGEEVKGAGPLNFTAYVKSGDPIVSVEVVSGGEVVAREAAGSAEASYAWKVPNPERTAYYYLRLTTESGERAWSSPIFVSP